MSERDGIMKTAIWMGLIAAMGLAGQASAQTPATCPCDASKIQRTDVATLVTGKTACATRGSERWQEFHQAGGSLIDYKLGPTSTTDPSEKVGTWLAPYLANPPRVISINYIIPEYAVDQSERDLFNEHAVILGSMGVTILVQSGDGGVAGDQECSYNPFFPASSPYVTTIGATQVF